MNPLILLILLFIWALLGVAMGFLAMRKGYNFAAWFLTGGFVLLGAIALGFMPNANDPSKSREDRDRMLERGNQLGLILSIVTLVLGFLSFGLQMFVSEMMTAGNAHDWSLVLFNALGNLLNWFELFFFAIVLVMYLAKSRHQRSVLVVLPLMLLMFADLGYIIMSLPERSFSYLPFELTDGLRMLIYFGLQMLNFFAFVILGIGILLLQPKKPVPEPEPEQIWLASVK